MRRGAPHCARGGIFHADGVIARSCAPRYPAAEGSRKESSRNESSAQCAAHAVPAAIAGDNGPTPIVFNVLTFV